jgi:hypothetical protein
VKSRPMLHFPFSCLAGLAAPIISDLGQRCFRIPKSFATTSVSVGAKVVVIFKTSIEHSASLALGHAIEFAFVVVATTEVFHCSSPSLPGGKPAV